LTIFLYAHCLSNVNSKDDRSEDFLQSNDRLFPIPLFGLQFPGGWSYPCRMLFDSKSANVARATAQGIARARFWRAQGFPNLVRARQARWKGHRKADSVSDVLPDSPFKLPSKPRRGY
jgi:hypothetical protein